MPTNYDPTSKNYKENHIRVELGGKELSWLHRNSAVVTSRMCPEDTHQGLSLHKGLCLPSTEKVQVKVNITFWMHLFLVCVGESWRHQPTPSDIDSLYLNRSYSLAPDSEELISELKLDNGVLFGFFFSFFLFFHPPPNPTRGTWSLWFSCKPGSCGQQGLSQTGRVFTWENKLTKKTFT